MIWYNDNDPYVAQWLRNLIEAGHLPQGIVDERSIHDIKPEEVAETSHFFAGIGGWPLALKLAGWPDNYPVWTGSCPCQPFSVAGRGEGERDPRHLWPEWYRLIQEHHPPIIFGEQVTGAIRLGWLDGVFGDLEKEGYACGATVLGAHSVGAPHIRQRIYWVADTKRNGWGGRNLRSNSEQEGAPKTETARPSTLSGLGITINKGSQGWSLRGDCADEHSAWSAGMAIPCADGKARRVEPSICPLAHGVPSRVGRLRAYGNAIVPQVAVEFIRAYMEISL